MGQIGGQGVEYWYNGLSRFPKLRSTNGEAGYVEVEDVNGEIVEKKARDQQRFEFVKAGVSALGFVMAVVGIWGDGA